MKTPQTPANLAIVALANSIAAQLSDMAEAGRQASLEHAALGDMNGTVGTLMYARDQIASLQAQIDAVLALHRK